MTQVRPGFDSHTWSDSQYSQIQYTGCSSREMYDTGVDLYKYNGVLPNDNEGTKKYTACFASSSSTSSGAWHDLPSGSYFFRVAYTDDNVDQDPYLTVKKVYIDTTAADS